MPIPARPSGLGRSRSAISTRCSKWLSTYLSEPKASIRKLSSMRSLRPITIRWSARCIGPGSRSRMSARRRSLPANGSATAARSNWSSPRTSRRRKFQSAANSNCCREALSGLAETQQINHCPAVGQFIEPQHGVDQGILPLRGRDRARELAEFLLDLRLVGETLFAAARCLAGLALDGAVAEIDFDAHVVPVRRTARSNGRVVNDLHPACQFDARAIVDAIGSELVDKGVAGENQ